MSPREANRSSASGREVLAEAGVVEAVAAEAEAAMTLAVEGNGLLLDDVPANFSA